MPTPSQSSLTSPRWSPRTKRIVVLIVLAVIFFAALHIGNAWYPVIIAVLLAYLLMPIVNAFDDSLTFVPTQSLRRVVAVLLTFTVVIGSLVIFGNLIIQPLSEQTDDFVQGVPDLIDSLRTDLSQPINLGAIHLVPWDTIEKSFNSGNQEGESSGDTFSSAIRLLLAPAANIVGGVFTFIASTFFTLALLFYAMKDGPQFVEAIKRIVPPSYHGDLHFFIEELGRIWNSYFRGQLVLGIAMGSITFIGASILGLPQPLVLGLLAGLLEFIPNVGPTLSATPAVLMALVTPSTTIPGLSGGILFALIVTAMYVGFQSVEGVVLVPRVMASNLNLHPFIVLMALIFGAKLAGIIGVILAAPITATLRLIMIYLWAKIFDIDLFGNGFPHSPPIFTSGYPLSPGPRALADPERQRTPDISEGEIVQE